jgi:hypothetical protein
VHRQSGHPFPHPRASVAGGGSAGARLLGVALFDADDDACALPFAAPVFAIIFVLPGLAADPAEPSSILTMRRPTAALT